MKCDLFVGALENYVIMWGGLRAGWANYLTFSSYYPPSLPVGGGLPDNLHGQV